MNKTHTCTPNTQLKKRKANYKSDLSTSPREKHFGNTFS